ncbi:MAG: hypothetical protein V5A39_05185 [Haloarculaceae archaeon]
MSSHTHEKLADVVSNAPNREWVAEFFEYAHELLSSDQISHHDGDDRLVMSLQSDRLAVTMNSRYVLVAFLSKQRVGFILRPGSERIKRLINEAEGHYSFNTLPGEESGESPDWVEFEDVSEYLTDESIRQNWLTAASIEFDRWSASLSKNAHEPLVKRMATDEAYRDEVLTEAFGAPSDDGVVPQDDDEADAADDVSEELPDSFEEFADQ